MLKVLRLAGPYQGIREKRLNRIALVETVTAAIGIEVAAHLKLVELMLCHKNGSPEEASFRSFAVAGSCLAELFSAGR